MKKLNLKLLFDIIIVSISFYIVLNSSYQCWKANKNAIAETEIAINNEADLSVIDINNRLLYVMKTGQDFADAITSGKIPYADVEHQAKQIMVVNHDTANDKPSKFYNVSVSFVKGAYDSSKPDQLANWIYVADKETGEIKLLKREYDYTVKNGSQTTNWFNKAVEEHRAFWQQPKYGDVSDHFLVAYSVPFFTSVSKEKVAGVIGIGFSTDELKAIMSKQNHRKTGFGMILSDEGHLIYHPNDLMPLVDVSNYYAYFEEAFEFLNKVKAGDKEDKTTYSYELPKTHEKAWVLSKIIPASQWRYQIVFLEKELGVDQKTLASKLNLIISTLIFIISCCYLIFIKSKITIRDLWLFSAILAISFSIGTAFLWKNADLKEMGLASNVKKIKSDNEIDSYKRSQDEFFSALHYQAPFYIPTGVFIKSTELLSSNNVIVAGYIWQKYQLDNSFSPNTTPDNFCALSSDKIPEDKSLLLFDAFADNENTTLSCDKSSYRVTKDHIVTLGWYFKAQLRQPFDYSKFPLDKNTIWLRMRPNSPINGIVLIPDFSSYANINETSLMGVDINDLVLPGWQVFSTFFSVQTTSLNSDFGITDHSQQASQELLFNVAIKRVFLDSVFSTVIPILLIYLILFVVLFSTLDDLLAVLGINAGLLFSVALWHSTLRTSLSSTGVTYFETFYFVCYFVISLVSINSVLLSCRYELPILHYQNNLLPKLIFPPLVSGITFLISLFMLF